MRAGLRGSWSNTSFRYLVSTSTIERDCANTIVLSPAWIARRAMRLLCERAEARSPRSGLTTGGFHSSTCLSPVRRAAFGDRRHRPPDQRFGVRLRIADRRRAQDELRRRAVERADPPEPTQHVGDVRAEYAAVGVDFVDHHEAQVLEELRPLGVVRQDRLVQHVRIADHDVAMQSDRLARIAWRVAVEGEGASRRASPARLSSSNSATWSCASALVGNRYSALACRAHRPAATTGKV